MVSQSDVLPMMIPTRGMGIEESGVSGIPVHGKIRRAKQERL
jgi:hypothetical protein